MFRIFRRPPSAIGTRCLLDFRNRFHFDVHASSDRWTVVSGRSIPLATRKERVDAEARRGDWRTSAPRSPDRLATRGPTITPMGMKDSEGNEFDIN